MQQERERFSSFQARPVPKAIASRSAPPPLPLLLTPPHGRTGHGPHKGRVSPPLHCTHRRTHGGPAGPLNPRRRRRPPAGLPPCCTHPSAPCCTPPSAPCCTTPQAPRPAARRVLVAPPTHHAVPPSEPPPPPTDRASTHPPQPELAPSLPKHDDAAHSPSRRQDRRPSPQPPPPPPQTKRNKAAARCWARGANPRQRRGLGWGGQG